MAAGMKKTFRPGLAAAIAPGPGLAASQDGTRWSRSGGGGRRKAVPPWIASCVRDAARAIG